VLPLPDALRPRPPPGQSAGVRAPDDDRTLDLSIDRLAFGGDALAYHDGRAVFVPLAAPGDRVRAAIVERRRDWLRAEVRQVVSPGPGRVAPPCPEFGTCGGCQWQHVTPAAQHAAKKAIVREQLERVGGIRDVDVRPVRAAPDAWGYRARITLAADGRRLGFRQARSHRLVEIADCAIADPVLSAHLEAARAWAAALRRAPTRVTLARAPDGVALVATLPGLPTPPDVAATERLLAATASVRGAVLIGAGARIVVGDPGLRVPVEPDLALEVPADAFTQVHAAANLLLVAAVLEATQVGPGARTLDLYCGAGNFALPLARRGADVTGVERSNVAIEAARANAARLGLPATFHCVPVEALLAGPTADRIDLVVLDPPRSGAREVVGALAARRPPRLVYVSCDPATLARDGRALTAAGYRLAYVQPVDLFPQTYHIETVAQFVLT
jgi:23S rRNA (uracil1939-C5)-methyltransferase